ELQATRKGVHGAVRLAPQQSPRTGLFDQVRTPLLHREPAGRVTEIYRSVRGDRGVVTHHQRCTVPGARQCPDRTGGDINGEQPAFGITHHEPVVAVQLDPEWPAPGIGDRVDPGAVPGNADDPAVLQSREHPALGVDNDILGTVAIDREQRHRTESHSHHSSRDYVPAAAARDTAGRKGSERSSRNMRPPQTNLRSTAAGANRINTLSGAHGHVGTYAFGRSRSIAATSARAPFSAPVSSGVLPDRALISVSM